MQTGKHRPAGMRTRSDNHKPRLGKKLLSLLGTAVFAAVVLLVLLILNSHKKEIEQGFEKAKEKSGVVSTISADSKLLEVHYIDVGQGDCELIICGGETMLIDAGENGNGSKITGYLRRRGVKKLNYVVATHPHSDHIGSLDEVLRAFETDCLIMPYIEEEYIPTVKVFENLLDAAEESGCKVKMPALNDSFNLGKAVLTVLGPVNQTENLNNMSLVLRLDYGEKTFLFEGDAEQDEETDILESGARVDCDVYKAGHHGSKYSSSAEYLAAASPQIVIISCSKDNAYGHPHKSALRLFGKYADKIYRTDLCSDIVVTTDGKTINVKCGA